METSTRMANTTTEASTTDATGVKQNPDAVHQECGDLYEAVQKTHVSLAACRQSSSEKVLVLRNKTYEDILEIAEVAPSLQSVSLPSDSFCEDGEFTKALQLFSESGASEKLAEGVKSLSDLLDINSVVDGNAKKDRPSRVR
eukprot:scpid74367/ scgid13888/ 